MTWTNQRRVESPVETFPGYVILPRELTPQQFDTWWRAYMAEQQVEDEGLASWFQGWRMRHHLVLEWHIEGLRAEDITADGMRLPSMRLLAWIARITADLPWEALDLPKSQAPSRGARNGRLQETNSQPSSETKPATPELSRS